MVAKRKASSSLAAPAKKQAVKTPIEDPDSNPSIIDAPSALRASPDEAVQEYTREASLSASDGEEDDEGLSSARPPAVNSPYLPLPWKGRIGYACLNTFLRAAKPTVFSSRTCRIASILDHRHPLRDPSQPEHATKNKPNKEAPADISLGQKWVESICLANVKDICRMVLWNDRFNIKFMRLSSEMFPFASHAEYGYKLTPFASEALAEAGQEIARLNHRVTMHPGQFTQLGSPRKVVVDNAIRDLEYHDELLSLLKLPDQLDKDAVMIMHMGGMFEGKAETLARFRTNYARLSPSIKNRLVLENDDVIWSVHDLLPVCEELNIPLVLDFHHHNIVFDASQLREGTLDIMSLFPRIKATWEKKGITQKMHYSEPCPGAITPKQRRKHSPRVATLPPCDPDMDLMIEAKDKEQAVFELMKTFKLPGFEKLADVVPHRRGELEVTPFGEVDFGGPEGRVYWPTGMEEWLSKKKRVAKKAGEGKPTPKMGKGKGKGALQEEEDSDGSPTPVKKGRGRKVIVSRHMFNDEEQPEPVKKGGAKKKVEQDDHGDDQSVEQQQPVKKKAAPKKAKGKKAVEVGAEDEIEAGAEVKVEEEPKPTGRKGRPRAKVNYSED
ncbi:UV-endonuclease UvdE [Piedraia hortae CBS 480.64]|uniref:UV-endonuclease UvdE n=1 Tax=Piedraia hortae CBS 480.64 TaxID=1314780 RepID=A0A6A7BSB8_9PEZI|nr:UV-endonuclease UvdE [Piedraia hortae CBS 480.64]